jgi:hypothetical protein
MMAFSLSDSSKSFSFASFGHETVFVAVHRFRCFISSGNIASAPYINRKGVKLIALQIVVLCLHTAVGMTSAHFPFFSPSNIFFIALNIRELTLSTAPFDYGWYTNVNMTFIPIWWQNSLNIVLSKYFALSTIWGLVTPYRHMMFCQKNFLIDVEFTLVSGFASIHFVKYSNATTVKV